VSGMAGDSKRAQHDSVGL